MKKIVLIGDSIRMGYQPLVVRKCREAQVWGPVANCGHSIRVLDNFQEWVADQKPDIVHVNFGIHDATIFPDGEHQILLAQYRLSLQRFIDKVIALGKAKMIWATTTPLYTPREDVPMAQWTARPGHEIQHYNAVALEIVRRQDVPVNDLHEVVMRNDFTKCLSPDGCHMTEFGNELLSDAVVKAVNALL